MLLKILFFLFNVFSYQKGSGFLSGFEERCPWKWILWHSCFTKGWIRVSFSHFFFYSRLVFPFAIMTLCKRKSDCLTPKCICICITFFFSFPCWKIIKISWFQFIKAATLFVETDLSVLKETKWKEGRESCTKSQIKSDLIADMQV